MGISWSWVWVGVRQWQRHGHERHGHERGRIVTRAWRAARRIVGTLAVVVTLARVAVALIRLAGLVGTVDGVAHSIGLGEVVAPFEAAFDAWVLAPVLEAVDVAFTPTPG